MQPRPRKICSWSDNFSQRTHFIYDCYLRSHGIQRELWMENCKANVENIAYKHTIKTTKELWENCSQPHRNKTARDLSDPERLCICLSCGEHGKIVHSEWLFGSVMTDESQRSIRPIVKMNTRLINPGRKRTGLQPHASVIAFGQ